MVPAAHHRSATVWPDVSVKLVAEPIIVPAALQNDTEPVQVAVVPAADAVARLTTFT